MYATGWHNGSERDDPTGYGLKLAPRDRDKYFDSSWTEVVLAFDGGGEVSIPLSASFWRTCTEIRSAAIGEWLIERGAAPWPASSPPGVVVTPAEGNHFTARILKRNLLPIDR